MAVFTVHNFMGGEIPPRLHWDARDFCSKLSARIMAGKEDMAEEIDDNAVDYGEDDYAGIIPVIRKYMRPGDNDDVRRALEVVVLDRKASQSFLQRRLKIGYNRAAEIMDLFEERGIVGAASGSGEKREILIFDSMDE